jgi:hypothetical protein
LGCVAIGIRSGAAVGLVPLGAASDHAVLKQMRLMEADCVGARGEHCA